MQERDVILMLPSMFHANAWGFPYSGWMSGADMVMPGPFLQGQHLRTMIEQTRPTLTAMVPTLLGDLLRADETLSARFIVFSRNRIGWIGGAVIDDRSRARSLGRPSGSGLGDD